MPWFRTSAERDMSEFAKNILSDPTSDGNIHDDISAGTAATAQAPSSPYRYEEFDRRTINEHDSDSSLTQTCPTCGGSGKLTKVKSSDIFTVDRKSSEKSFKTEKEQEHDLVALIPVRDSRLKPRRTVLYLILAIFICLTISVVVGVFLFPRNISIHLDSAFPMNITIPKSNKSDPFIVINTTITIKNSNFFEAVLDGFSIEVNWEDYVVANPDISQTIKVPPRSSICHTFKVTTKYVKQEAIKIRRICCGWSFNLAFLITVSAKTHSLTVSSEASDNGFKYINCELKGLKWWKTCFN